MNENCEITIYKIKIVKNVNASRKIQSIILLIKGM